MTSEIRTNTITSRAGLSTVTFTDSGPMFSGITTFVDNSTFSVGTGGTIHAPATNVMALGTNSIDAIKIDSSGNVNVTGILTASSINGGVSLANGANDRVVTATGASALTGEQYFTWNGNNLALRGGQNQNCTIELASDQGDSAADFWRLMAQNSDNALAIDHYGSGSWVERLRIDSSGRLLVGQTSGSSPLCVSGTDPVIAELHHSDGGTNDQSRISLGALASNPPSQRGINLIAENNGAGHDFVVATSPSHSLGPTEKLRINSSGGLKLSNTAGGHLFEYGGSSVNTVAAIDINRFGNGYADIRLSSNYGASLRLAGASDNTDEYLITQDNQKNAYHNLEYDGFINFNTNNTTQAMRLQGGKVGINKNIETLTGNGFAAALQVNNKTTDGYGTIMMGGGYNRGTIGIGNVYDLILTSNAYPANASTGGIKFRCGNSGGGGPTQRARIHQDGMFEVNQETYAKTYFYSSARDGVYSTLVVEFNPHQYHSFVIDISVAAYANKWGSARYLGYCNGSLFSADQGPFETTSANAITMVHSHVSGQTHKVTCALNSCTHPVCEFRITIGGVSSYLDTGDISFSWS